jgi:adenylate cyclase class 2
MVEIKARVRDFKFLQEKLSDLGADYVGTFKQKDVYFKVPEGRLKLREIESDSNLELIYYERENTAGPKRDDAFILKFQQSEDLRKILKKILRPLNTIEKIREVYRYQGTQIHLDTVKSLGKFIEFERQITHESKNIEKEKHVLEKLMEILKIDSDNLEILSYNELCSENTILDKV